jgi:hypothetical protein
MVTCLSPGIDGVGHIYIYVLQGHWLKVAYTLNYSEPNTPLDAKLVWDGIYGLKRLSSQPFL